MLSQSEFVKSLTDAYGHLYDLVHLGSCRLADLLFPEPAMRRKDKAWQFQRVLLDAIEELNSGPNTPVFSREWRRYRLMVMRYVDGSDPQTVAEQLKISRRHYYREHDIAIEAISEVLMQRLGGTTPSANTPSLLSSDTNTLKPSSDRAKLLRAEIARSTQSIQRTHLGEVVQSTIRMLHEQLEEHNTATEQDLHNLPNVAVDRGLLRQILLSVTRYVVEKGKPATLRFNASADDEFVRLNIAVEETNMPQPAAFVDAQAHLAVVQEIAAMSNVRVTLNPAGFELTVPIVPKRTVLIIDDNHDLLELFQRWLNQHGYSAVAAHTARDGIELAKQLQPFAITLDLMMPEQDGWDALQTLSTQPNTSRIPVIVCSVLRQEDLALSLGASAFLLKPVTMHDLLSVLEELQAAHPAPSAPTAPHHPA